MGTFPHKKPLPRRHTDRRAGHATRMLRQAFDGSRVSDDHLTPAEIRRQRDKRTAHRRARGRSGRGVAEVAIAVGLVLLVFMILANTLRYLS